MKTLDRNPRDRETAFTGRIVAGVSHEFMNVLATIRESSGLMEDLLALDETPFPSREKVKRSIGIIQAQVRRGMDVGKGLNKFAHSMDDTKTDLVINDVLDQLAFLMDRFVRMKGIQLTVKRFESPVRIQTDPFRFQAVLNACIEHCLAHTEKGGLITLQGRMRKEDRVIQCLGHPFSGNVGETENLIEEDPDLKMLLSSVGASLSVLNSEGVIGFEMVLPQ